MWVEASPDGAALDIERERPARLQRRGREPGERLPGGPADPFGAAPCGRGASQRRDRSRVPGRAPVPGGRSGHDLPGLVGEPGEQGPPSRGRAAQRTGEAEGLHVRRCSAARSISSWRRWPWAELRPDRRAAALHPRRPPGSARERQRNPPRARAAARERARDAARKSGQGSEVAIAGARGAHEREGRHARCGLRWRCRAASPRSRARVASRAARGSCTRPAPTASAHRQRCRSARRSRPRGARSPRRRVRAGRALEPAVEDLLEQRLARGAQGQREHVRVVPAAGAAGGLGVAAERGPHPGHLVRRDRGAGARPAADDRPGRRGPQPRRGRRPRLPRPSRRAPRRSARRARSGRARGAAAPRPPPPPRPCARPLRPKYSYPASLVLRRARVARGGDHRTPPDGGAGRCARGVGARAGHGGAQDLRPAARRAGRAELDGVRRIGKMLAVESGDLTLLVHLMSAGRLQLFDARASLRDRASRVLRAPRRWPRAAAARVRHQAAGVGEAAALDAVAEDDAVAGLGPDAYPAPPLEEFANLLDQPRHLHPLLRDQRTIAGIGRSWVDELLWTARLSPFQKGADLERRRDRGAPRRLRRGARRGARALRGGGRRHRARQDADAAPGTPPRRRGVPTLRSAHRGDPLQGLRDVLLPGGADGRAGAEGPEPVEVAEVIAVTQLREGPPDDQRRDAVHQDERAAVSEVTEAHHDPRAPKRVVQRRGCLDPA